MEVLAPIFGSARPGRGAATWTAAYCPRQNTEGRWPKVILRPMAEKERPIAPIQIWNFGWFSAFGNRVSVFQAALRSLGLVLLAAICSAAAPAGSETPREYQIKAGFLFKFTQFIEWPSTAFENGDSPMVIGVLGTDPFRGFLDETVRDELAKGRPVVVQRYRRVEEIKTCHILFIGSSEAHQLDHIHDVLKGKPVLTVSDLDGAARSGPIIRLLTERNRVRLRINVEEARVADLTISSKLLRAAEIVGADTK